LLLDNVALRRSQQSITPRIDGIERDHTDRQRGEHGVERGELDANFAQIHGSYVYSTGTVSW
jgi:hypothetical protein